MARFRAADALLLRLLRLYLQLLLLLPARALLGIRLLQGLLNRRYGELVLQRLLGGRRQGGCARARVLLHLQLSFTVTQLQ